MDSEAQKAGERCVWQYLIDPLKRRGLAKPSSLTNDLYQDMLKETAQRLAYMSVDGLAALEESAAARPGGKDGDRFPILNNILTLAIDIERPPDDASPLLRKVMAHDVGQGAIVEGWAPELLHYVRSKRVWPKGFALTQVRQSSDDAVRRMRDIERRMASGQTITADEAKWRDRRKASIEKCKSIAALSRAGE
ncbi:MAG: hypothetical protein ABJO27_14145 [Pseudoruegeria sp.]